MPLSIQKMKFILFIYVKLLIQLEIVIKYSPKSKEFLLENVGIPVCKYMISGDVTSITRKVLTFRDRKC